MAESHAAAAASAAAAAAATQAMLCDDPNADACILGTAHLVPLTYFPKDSGIRCSNVLTAEEFVPMVDGNPLPVPAVFLMVEVTREGLSQCGDDGRPCCIDVRYVFTRLMALQDSTSPLRPDLEYHPRTLQAIAERIGNCATQLRGAKYPGLAAHLRQWLDASAHLLYLPLSQRVLHGVSYGMGVGAGLLGSMCLGRGTTWAVAKAGLVTSTAVAGALAGTRVGQAADLLATAVLGAGDAATLAYAQDFAVATGGAPTLDRPPDAPAPLVQVPAERAVTTDDVAAQRQAFSLLGAKFAQALDNPDIATVATDATGAEQIVTNPAYMHDLAASSVYHRAQAHMPWGYPALATEAAPVAWPALAYLQRRGFFSSVASALATTGAAVGALSLAPTWAPTAFAGVALLRVAQRLYNVPDSPLDNGLLEALRQVLAEVGAATPQLNLNRACGHVNQADVAFAVAYVVTFPQTLLHALATQAAGQAGLQPEDFCITPAYLQQALAQPDVAADRLLDAFRASSYQRRWTPGNPMRGYVMQDGESYIIRLGAPDDPDARYVRHALQPDGSFAQQELTDAEVRALQSRAPWVPGMVGSGIRQAQVARPGSATHQRVLDRVRDNQVLAVMAADRTLATTTPRRQSALEARRAGQQQRGRAARQQIVAGRRATADEPEFAPVGPARTSGRSRPKTRTKRRSGRPQ